jgi:HK97 family phage major capsid protein
MATMQYELKELRAKSATLVNEALAKHNEINSETTESRAKEIETEVDAMLASRDALETRIARAEKLADFEALDVDPRRPTDTRSVRGSGEAVTETVAFQRWLGNMATREERSALRAGAAFAKDSAYWTPELESRAQGEATGSAGGYLVPIELANEIIISLKKSGPMMDGNFINLTKTSTGATMNWPTMDDTSNEGYLISENTQVTSNAVSLGQVPVSAYKYSTGVVQYSSELAQDSAFNVADFLTKSVAVRAARVANQDLTTGSGTSMPQGILTAIGNAAVSSANTAVLGFDDVLALIHSVDPLYRENPKTAFQMHDTTFKALRLQKDDCVEKPAVWRAGWSVIGGWRGG